MPEQAERWLLVTDRSPEVSTAAWYGLRAWIEPGFKLTKRGGWQWQRTRMTHPARATRLWLAVAGAALWPVSVGRAAEDAIASSRVPDVTAVLGIVGFFDVPLIYFSAEWWRNLHPGPVFITPDGPQMPPEMLISILVMLGGMTLLYVALLLVRVRLEATAERIEQARIVLEQG